MISVTFNNKSLSRDSILNYIECDLDTTVVRLDLGHQKQCDNDILLALSNSVNSGALRYINLISTNITYNGLIKLWNSSIIGCLISDVPTYETHTGYPISVIEIEIGNTPLYKQYKDKKFKYPLPLLRNFEITYGYRCMGKPYQLYGYKQIKLLDRGKELLKSTSF